MNNLRFDLLVFKEEWPEPRTEEVEQDGGREAWAVLENHLHILSHCPGKNILFILFLKVLEKEHDCFFLNLFVWTLFAIFLKIPPCLHERQKFKNKTYKIQNQVKKIPQV